MTNEARDQLLMDMHADIKVLVKSDAAHEKTLYGNGKPGLCETVTKISMLQKECRDQKKMSYVKVAAWSSLVSPLSVLAFQNLLEWIGK